MCIERSFIFTFSHSCLQITMVLTLKLQNAGNHHCLLVCHPETEKSGIVFRTSCQRHSVSHITWILQDRHHSKDWHTTLHLGEPQIFFFFFFKTASVYGNWERKFSSLIGMFYSSCVTHCLKLWVFSRVWCINCWSAIHNFHNKFFKDIVFRILLPGFTKAGKWGGGVIPISHIS